MKNPRRGQHIQNEMGTRSERDTNLDNLRPLRGQDTSALQDTLGFVLVGVPVSWGAPQKRDTRLKHIYFTVFWCNQRGADDPWPISADFLNPRLSGLSSFPKFGGFTADLLPLIDVNARGFQLTIGQPEGTGHPNLLQSGPQNLLNLTFGIGPDPVILWTTSRFSSH